MRLLEVQIENFLNLLKNEFRYILDMAYNSSRYDFYEKDNDFISINLSNIDYLISVISNESKKYLKKDKGFYSFCHYLNFINEVLNDVLKEIAEELEEVGDLELLDTAFFYDLAESIFNFRVYLNEIDEIVFSCEEYYDKLKSSKVKHEIEKFSSFTFVDNFNGFYFRNKKEIYTDLLAIINDEKFKENDVCLDKLEKNIKKSYNKEFLSWIYLEDKAPTEGEIYITIDEFNEEVEAIYLNKNFVYLSSDDIVSDVIAYKNV